MSKCVKLILRVGLVCCLHDDRMAIVAYITDIIYLSSCHIMAYV